MLSNFDIELFREQRKLFVADKSLRQVIMDIIILWM